MKVKLLGITLQTGKGISLAEFFEHLAKNQNKAIEHGGHPRLLYVAEEGSYYIGLLITTKDQKKFLELTQGNGNVEIVTRDVSDGALLADFNFFLIHKKTGRGIYQHYYQSCALNQFGYLARKHYEELKKAKIEAEKQSDSSVAKIKSIKKQFDGTLEWMQLVRPETFDKLVASFSHIHSFKFKFFTVKDEEPVFRPLANISKSVTQAFTFHQNTVVTSVADAIRAALNTFNVDKGRIEGVDSDGIEQVIFLENNPDSFGEFDYDTIADKLKKLAAKDFAGTWFMDEILKVAKAQNALLSTPTKI
ncbi:MAG: hypothetical protein ACYCZJ_06845 [Sulfuriferula sp.]